MISSSSKALFKIFAVAAFMATARSEAPVDPEDRSFLLTKKNSSILLRENPDDDRKNHTSKEGHHIRGGGQQRDISSSSSTLFLGIDFIGLNHEDDIPLMAPVAPSDKHGTSSGLNNDGGSDNHGHDDLKKKNTPLRSARHLKVEKSQKGTKSQKAAKSTCLNAETGRVKTTEPWTKSCNKLPRRGQTLDADCCTQVKKYKEGGDEVPFTRVEGTPLPVVKEYCCSICSGVDCSEDRGGDGGRSQQLVENVLLP